MTPGSSTARRYQRRPAPIRARSAPILPKASSPLAPRPVPAAPEARASPVPGHRLSPNSSREGHCFSCSTTGLLPLSSRRIRPLKVRTRMPSSLDFRTTASRITPFCGTKHRYFVRAVVASRRTAAKEEIVCGRAGDAPKAQSRSTDGVIGLEPITESSKIFSPTPTRVVARGKAVVPHDGGAGTGSHGRPKPQRKRTAMEYFAGLCQRTG
jgi:hypothetical protein